MSGTSAGGLASYYHAAFIKSQLKASGARLVAAPDAGFFMNHLSIKGVPAWKDDLLAGATLWNGTLRGAGAACMQGKAPADQASGRLCGYVSDSAGGRRRQCQPSHVMLPQA